MCGKTSYGRVAASLSGLPFIDLDDHIIEGVTPGEIIRTQGQEAFRELETEALRKVLEQPGDCILALGGGTPLREENRALLREKCRVIWLKASLEESVFNPEWASLAAQRPLLDGGDRARIEALWQSRIPVYQEIADHTISTDGKTPQDIVAEIVRIIYS